MRTYYPIVNSDNKLLALTQEKTADALNVTFAEDYLTRLGITLGTDIKVVIPNGLINYEYLPEKNQIGKLEDLSIYQRAYTNTARTACDNAIFKGVELNGRVYDTEITDQLGYLQAQAIAEVEGVCDIKCNENGVSSFVAHTLAQCKELNYNVAKHILEQRKKLFDIKAQIANVKYADDLSALKWSK